VRVQGRCRNLLLGVILSSFLMEYGAIWDLKWKEIKGDPEGGKGGPPGPGKQNDNYDKGLVIPHVFITN
jgi:hypothetical protein